MATGYVYDRAGGLVSRVDDSTITSYAYDAYGNQTSAATAVNQLTTSTYDAADRLTAITPPGASATTFSFDALGRHASRTTPSGTDTYAYLGTSETVWQIDSGGSLTRSSREPSGALAAIDAAGSDGFVLADLHGNLAAVVNAAETAYLSAVRYDPYGQTAASYDAGGAFPSPWGFQARLDVSPDAANPLYDFGARFYAPATGAFTQLDSYAGSPGDPLSLNRYLYAAANPWTLVDPSGHYYFSGVEPEDGEKAVYLTSTDPTTGAATTIVHQIAAAAVASLFTPAVAHGLLEYADFNYNYYSGASRAATELSAALRNGSSQAARLLPEVGSATKLLRSTAFRLAGHALLGLGAFVEYEYQRSEGRDELESIVRSAAITGGSVAGAATGGAACAFVAGASFGLGAAGCGGLIAGGSFVGGIAAEVTLDAIGWIADNVDITFWD